jgi:hypothetical protein
MSLAEVLGMSDATALFVKFLLAERGEHRLLFWQEVEAFRAQFASDSFSDALQLGPFTALPAAAAASLPAALPAAAATTPGTIPQTTVEKTSDGDHKKLSITTSQGDRKNLSMTTSHGDRKNLSMTTSHVTGASTFGENRGDANVSALHQTGEADDECLSPVNFFASRKRGKAFFQSGEEKMDEKKIDAGLAKAQYIKEMYIDSQEVCITNETKQAISASIGAGVVDPSLFTTAQHEVFEEIQKTTCFARFKQSPLFRAFLESQSEELTLHMPQH